MAWHKNEEKKKPIEYCPSSSKCYNLLKKVPPKQRKPVSFVSSFVTPVPKSLKIELKTTKTPVFVKTTPVIISE